MNTAGKEVDDALSLIRDAGLPHPSGPLLESFVTDALNPVLAARYVKSRLLLDEGVTLISNWSFIIESIIDSGSVPPPPDAAAQRAITRRDGNRCCITGRPGAYGDPLIVVSILPVPSGWITNRDHINDMLGAFFGSPYRDWWVSYVKSPGHMDTTSNHWLVRRSAAKAFARGYVRLDRRQPSMIEYQVQHVRIKPEEPIRVDGMYPLLGDHSRQGIQKVDPRFVGTHARLCKAIQLLDISNSLSSETSPPSPTSYPTQIARNLSKALLRPIHVVFGIIPSGLLMTWRLAPGKLKIFAYGMLIKLGRLLYGPQDEQVQRLPFGLYLKYHGSAEEARNEFNALQLVRQHTSIPTPLALDVVCGPRDSNSVFSPPAYLLSTRIPGFPLSRCFYVLSDKDCNYIAMQLKDYVVQLRGIPHPLSSVITICNTLGEACRDTRIRGATHVGPFNDEAEFSQVLRFSDEPARRGHKIIFTHADLNPRNILVDRFTRSDGSTGWRVSGIVDWESAGYYPEYWEYTKAMFEGFRWPKRHNDLVHDVFRELGDYSQEFDVEQRSWESGDAV